MRKALKEIKMSGTSHQPTQYGNVSLVRKAKDEKVRRNQKCKKIWHKKNEYVLPELFLYNNEL